MAATELNFPASFFDLLRAFTRIGFLSFGGPVFSAKWSVPRVLGVAALGGAVLVLAI